ncbi:MAG: HAMP domain-containing protein [Anaerolineales bacterium]|nr:HAMP domain-containing protein [Anaerolineales bacterium]
MSIRLKVILPFLILTVVVAMIGIYVVTRLVANSLSDRLTNQLLEAGRVVSDSFIRQESSHVETARSIVFLEGLPQAVSGEDGEKAFELAAPVFVGLSGADSLILISPRGTELVHFYMDSEGKLQQVMQDTGASRSQIVAPFLSNRNVDEEPHRALGVNLANDEVYYYTGLPISNDGEFAGVVVIGTSIKSILPYLKSIVLADVIIYGGNGRAIATTMGAGDEATLGELSISEYEYQQVLSAKEFVVGKNFKLNARDYRLLRGPLQVGNDRIGVFAVVLPSEFVLQQGAESRGTYTQLFVAVMLIVVIIGFFISRLITSPLYSLVNTSQAIASGNLEQRTGIRSRDEIGELAVTFDDMTAKLQERTEELEQINERLRKMDRTKTNFIQISAHELRTPLTLIMGYSQMLEQDTRSNPELQKLAQGILEGSERMTDIVDSMLDVSRIDSKALVLRKVSVEMDMVIKKVRRGFNDALSERNIKLDTDEISKLPPVYADPELIHKVFYHIIMNAIKFTPDGGSIKVAGRYLNGDVPPQVEVTVSDTGIGIDPATIPFIFEKFGQTGEVLLHSSGKTKFKGGGPGLGLAIARGIVNAHGGEIRAESPGYNEHTFPGSKFIVTLPVEKQVETEP